MRKIGCILEQKIVLQINIIIVVIWKNIFSLRLVMNIIHIITTIDRGGAENQLVQNLLFQKKKGLNLTVLFLKGFYPKKKVEIKKFWLKAYLITMDKLLG